MSDQPPSWLRRHRRPVAIVALALVAAGGVGLMRAVERLRWSASRSADL